MSDESDEKTENKRKTISNEEIVLLPEAGDNISNPDIRASPEQSKAAIFFTNSLLEGYTHEEVTETTSDLVFDDPDGGTMFTAVPLIFPSTSAHSIRHSDILQEDEYFEPSGSDSEVELFPLHFDSSEEELDTDGQPLLYFFSDSGTEVIRTGNIPLFDKIEATPEKHLIIRPLIARSKSMPTETCFNRKAIDVWSPVVRSGLRSNPVSSADTSRTAQRKSNDFHFIPPYTHEYTKKQPSYKSARKTFCSTNVQTKILQKIGQESEKKSTASKEDTTPQHTSLWHVSKASETITSKDVSDLIEISVEIQETETDKTHDTSKKSNPLKDSDENEIKKAFEKSLSEGSVMPILKKELHTKIQLDRVLRGEPELVLEEEQPKTYKLRPEEVIKKQRRLSQNRESARKSRFRAKNHEQSLKKVIKQQMNELAKLSKEIENLTKHRNTLQTQYDDHMKCCHKDLKL